MNQVVIPAAINPQAQVVVSLEHFSAITTGGWRRLFSNLLDVASGDDRDHFSRNDLPIAQELGPPFVLGRLSWRRRCCGGFRDTHLIGTGGQRLPASFNVPRNAD